MIRTQALTKSFGPCQAVQAVDIAVQPGEIFGLVGPDGAGKTTLLRMLTGLLDADSGTIDVCGAANPEAVKGEIGYIPQRFSLCGDLSVGENLRIFGALYGQSRAHSEVRAQQILTFTNLLPFKERLADQLSGGMKQKLALAAGLLHQPRLFVLDEPTTGVDPVSRREFWELLYQLNQEGMTIVVSTPYMDEAELCTRIAFMDRGRITACATPAAMRRQYPYQLIEVRGLPELPAAIAQADWLQDHYSYGLTWRLVVTDAAAALAALPLLLPDRGNAGWQAAIAAPSLDDVFIALMEGGRA